MEKNWQRVAAINKARGRGRRVPGLCCRMPTNQGGYYAAGISLRDLEGRWKEESLESLNIRADKLFREFSYEWGKLPESSKFEAHVFHPVTAEQYGEDRFRYVPHLHVVYWHYKMCIKTDFIRDWAKARGFRFWYTACGRVSDYMQYLRKPPRQVFFEKGRMPAEGPKDPNQPFRGGREGLGCDMDMAGGRGVGEGASSSDEDSKGPDDSITGGRVYAAKGARRKESIWERLDQLMRRFRVTDEVSLGNRIFGTDDRELIQWYQHVKTDNDWRVNLETAIAKYTAWVKNQDWEVLLDLIPEDPEEISQGRQRVMTVSESLYYLKEILMFQLGSMDAVREFLYECYLVMNRWSGKKNCIYLKGPASSAKSWFATGLKLSMHTYYTHGNLGKNTSNFVWQELATRNVFHFEEPMVDPVHIDDLKTILGGQTLDVQIKYKSAGQVDRIPVICTTNHDLWRFNPGDQSAIKARSYYYVWKTLPETINVTGALHPKVFEGLIKHYGFRERYSPVGVGKSISLADFDPEFVVQPMSATESRKRVRDGGEMEDFEDQGAAGQYVSTVGGVNSVIRKAARISVPDEVRGDAAGAVHEAVLGDEMAGPSGCPDNCGGIYAGGQEVYHVDKISDDVFMGASLTNTPPDLEDFGAMGSGTAIDEWMRELERKHIIGIWCLTAEC